MGHTISGGFVVDQAGLSTAASDLAHSAATVRNYVGDISNNLFGAGRNGQDCEAGKEYVARGQEVHDAMTRVVNWLNIWTTAVEDTASAIGKVSIETADVDENNARKTGKV
ncbi:hypothetical protein [Nocardia bovistercoris]|uniref:ESX-1 secretion-associated protein n=1 Tax=Nocardia bovistercoris TaxID=2785916 RepID=A0A931N3T3_9NOCA|nr:hypothetical protein [Nocardia bovistercoris]MBH0777531.1 hypothetical protein [Nocardia bovistercoris]